MEFLVDFEINIPEGTPEFQVLEREKAEAAAAARLVHKGHLVRLWKLPVACARTRVLGLYRADSKAQLDGLLEALPLRDWMDITVSPLEPHPNDPAAAHSGNKANSQLSDRCLTRVYRLEATLTQPLRVGNVAGGHRRIVALAGGTFSGPEINGKLLPGYIDDWQILLPDGTALGDIRYTLQTDRGDVLYVQSRGVRHGSEEVLARLARGEEVDASEYTFRTSTQIKTTALDLDWMNNRTFISFACHEATRVVYETYLVG